MIDRRRRTGAALVLVIGFLAVLLTLVVAMARMTGVERSVARTSVLSTEARAAAEAGIEHAVAGLRSLALSDATTDPAGPWFYRGEDFDGDGILSGLHEDPYANGEFEIAACPIEYALRPSFALLEGGQPVVVGTPAISGRVEVPVDDGRQRVYTLKVTECAAAVDVNGGEGDVVATAAIGRMVDRLWEEIARRSPGAPAVRDLGRWLIARRPAGGFADEEALRETLGRLDPGDPSIGAAVFRRLAPHVTCHPWRDETVLVCRGAERGTDPVLEISGPLPFERLETTSRAPVDVNAADVVVLYACLADISGWVFVEGSLYHRDPQTGLPDYSSPRPGATSTPDTYQRIALDRDRARATAERIVERRRTAGPFRTWDAFGDLLEALVEDRTISRDQASLIRAQASPDSDLNKFHPDAALYCPVDKSDLIEFSTELTLASTGRYEIESYGQVYDAQRNLLAASVVRVVAEIFRTVRDTTADDFRQGVVGPFQGAGFPAVEVLPETGPGTDYDGQLALATHRPTFRLTPSLHATFSGRDTGWLDDLIGDNRPTAGPLVGPAAERGSILGDGVASNRSTYPEFSTQEGHLSDVNGAIAFWYKPNWNMISAAPRPHCILNVNGLGEDSVFQIYNDTRVPAGSESGPPKPMLKFLAFDKGSNQQVELSIDLAEISGPNEWLHVACYWTEHEIFLFVRGTGTPPSGEGDAGDYRYDGRVLRIVESAGQYVLEIDGATADENTLFHRNDAPDKIPWPGFAGAEGRFPSRESVFAWLDGLLTNQVPGQDEWRSSNYRNVLGPNGVEQMGKFERQGKGQTTFRYSLAAEGFVADDIQFGTFSDPTTAVRLGGSLRLADPGNPESFVFVEAASNGTYGDLAMWGGIPNDGAAIRDQFARLANQGRYYRGGDAFFESRPLPIPAGSRIGTIRWKAFVPDGSSGLEVDFGGLSLGGPGSIDRPAAGDERYRIRFLDRPEEGTPLLATPIVDSVTITYLPPVSYLRWIYDLEGAPTAPE